MAGIIATLANRGTHLVAPLVVHTVDQFEPQELLEFFGFLGMLAHRLRVRIITNVLFLVIWLISLLLRL
jgi:exportin-T